MGFTPGPFELLVLLVIGGLLLLPVVGIAYVVWLLAKSGSRQDHDSDDSSSV